MKIGLKPLSGPNQLHIWHKKLFSAECQLERNPLLFSDSNQRQGERCPKVTLDEAADKSFVRTSHHSPASHCFQSSGTYTIIDLLLLRHFRHGCYNKLCIWRIFGVIWEVRLDKILEI